jgi:hypothetical protein
MANLGAEADCKTAVALGMAGGRLGYMQQVHIGCAGWSIPREAARYFDSEGKHMAFHLSFELFPQNKTARVSGPSPLPRSERRLGSRDERRHS